MDTYKLTLKQEVLKELAANIQSVFCKLKLNKEDYDEKLYKRVIELDDKILFVNTQEEIAKIEKELVTIKKILNK